MSLQVAERPFNNAGQYTGKIEVNFQEKKERDSVSSLYIQIRMHNITAKCFTGTCLPDATQSLQERVWDWVTPIYNPTAAAFNFSMEKVNAFCSRWLGCSPDRVFGRLRLGFHCDRKSAVTVLERISQAHTANFEIQPERIEEADLRHVLQNEESVRGYAAGKPKSNNTVLTTFHLRDSLRPSAGEVSQFAKETLNSWYFERMLSAYTAATPYTGLAIWTNDEEDPQVIGRAANGGSAEPNRSESGLIIHPDFRGRGWGKQSTIALVVHAFVCANLLHFPLHSKTGQTKVDTFSATVRPSDQMDERIEQLGLQILKGPYTPYPGGGERLLVGISRKDMPKFLETLLAQGIENQLTINGQSPTDFYEAHRADLPED